MRDNPTKPSDEFSHRSPDWSAIKYAAVFFSSTFVMGFILTAKGAHPKIMPLVAALVNAGIIGYATTKIMNKIADSTKAVQKSIETASAASHCLQAKPNQGFPATGYPSDCPIRSKHISDLSRTCGSE